MSRRQGGLEFKLGPAAACEPRHVVIDANGLKVFGAGEWTVRKRGMRRGRRRAWRKLHLDVDEKTKEMVAVDLATSGVHDSSHLPALLSQVAGPIGQVSGDGACESGACYEAILTRGAVPTIPPRRNARPNRINEHGEPEVRPRLATPSSCRIRGIRQPRSQERDSGVCICLSPIVPRREA